MFLQKHKNETIIAMSNTDSTIFKSKFKPRPLSSVSSRRRGNWSIWPKGMSYNGWKNLSKSLNWFFGKDKKINRLKEKC